MLTEGTSFSVARSSKSSGVRGTGRGCFFVDSAVLALAAAAFAEVLARDAAAFSPFAAVGFFVAAARLLDVSPVAAALLDDVFLVVDFSGLLFAFVVVDFVAVDFLSLVGFELLERTILSISLVESKA